jgi:nucleotide-binding universal stress UspA family protein
MSAALLAHPLLATEHSEYDAGAERVAFALAARLGVALHLVLPIAGNAEFDAVAPELAARADAAAAAKLHRLRAQAAGHGVALEPQVCRGPDLYREIVEAARDGHADLIVIRRRGRVGLLANLLLGEMVGKVIAHAACDVLVAARGAHLWERRVLAAVNPAAPDAAAIAARAAHVAAAFALPLTLATVVDSAEREPAAQASLEQLAAAARRLGVTADAQVRSGRTHEALIDLARTCAADLIVIGRHGGARLPRAWIGGVAQKVLGLAECAVWVCVAAATAGESRQ